jgi:hypothetical protein
MARGSLAFVRPARAGTPPPRPRSACFVGRNEKRGYSAATRSAALASSRWIRKSVSITSPKIA